MTARTLPLTKFDPVQESPAQFVRNAWDAGRRIVLSGCGYGKIHWGNQRDVSNAPISYYRFLAGVAYLTGAKTALELGTHWGGSARAIARGMRDHSKDNNIPSAGRVVTIDITTESDSVLSGCFERPMIEKIVGDANSPEVVRKVQAILGNSVDLLYLDADHALVPTLLNFSIYTTLLRPKLVLFDDILLNDQMRSFWNIASTAYPDSSVNCIDVVPEIRSGEGGPPGFGLILMP
jgi:hypothetical protein